MSYNPKKGFHRDEHGMIRFDVEASMPTSTGKEWHTGTIVRKVLNGKDEVIAKDKQVCQVYARPEEVAAKIFTQCPSPFKGTEGRLMTDSWYERSKPDQKF